MTCFTCRPSSGLSLTFEHSSPGWDRASGKISIALQDPFFPRQNRTPGTMSFSAIRISFL
ncbi:7679_t:CDS:2, partial [Dentiscutata erythropus]